MSFSEASNRELNDELQTLVAAGDDAARTRMIETNMRLAAYKVDQFITQRPQFAYLKDDLLSEAFVGLTEGVNQIRDVGAGDNPTGLLAMCIERQLKTAVKAADTIRTPRRTPHSEARAISGLAAERLASDPNAERELRETIDACCTSDDERLIVARREAGYSDAEIAAEIDLPRKEVGRIRKGLAAKFRGIA